MQGRAANVVRPSSGDVVDGWMIGGIAEIGRLSAGRPIDSDMDACGGMRR